MDNYDVVKKLIGPVNPVGDSSIDARRFENLKQLTYLVEKLMTDVATVAFDNKDRQEHSRKRAGQYAHKFYGTLPE